MSNIKQFLRTNKKVKPNAFYAASDNFLDADGKSILWEIRPLSTEENETIKAQCTEVIEDGYRKPKVSVDSKMIQAKQIVASVVFPDLFNAELQDSYGVKTPEELLFAMLDGAGDYQRLVMFILKYNRLDVTLDDRIKEAKNS